MFSDMTADEEDEYIEQLAAQIAVLAVKLPELYIKEACKSAVLTLTKKPKTKYEYNNERKRAVVKVCKPKAVLKVGVSTEVEPSEVSVYAMLGEDPPLFIRNYQKVSFQALIKDINPMYTTYDRIQKVDLTDQRIGDSGLDSLCAGLRGSPCEVISLVNCDITDDGLCNHLSGALRTMFELHELYINQNLFGDRGIASLFLNDTYSRSLKLINISRNSFTSKSALYIGSMFVSTATAAPAPVPTVTDATPTISDVSAAMAAAVNALSSSKSSANLSRPVSASKKADAGPTVNTVRQCKLEAIFAGGILSNRNGGEGDRFVRVLCGQLMTANARPLKELHVPDMNLSDSGGLRSIAALIAISPSLHTVNITRNAITTPSTKCFFYLSLMLNKDLQNLMMGQCGLDYADLKSFELIKRKNRELRAKQMEMIRLSEIRQQLQRNASIAPMLGHRGTRDASRYHLGSVSEVVSSAHQGIDLSGAVQPDPAIMVNSSSNNASTVNVHGKHATTMSNVMTWHEKVTAGLMIAKEVSINEHIRYRLNYEVFNMWKELKPVQTPARIVDLYHTYIDFMTLNNLSPDPLAYLLRKSKEPPPTGSSRPQSTASVTVHAASASGSLGSHAHAATTIDTKSVHSQSPPSTAGIRPATAVGGDIISEYGDTGAPPTVSKDIKFLPIDIETSLRCAMLFADYIKIFVEPDRQLALTFIRPLTAEEITKYEEQTSINLAAAAKEERKSRGKSVSKSSKSKSKKVQMMKMPLEASVEEEEGSLTGILDYPSEEPSVSLSLTDLHSFSTLRDIPAPLTKYSIPYNMTAVSILGKNETIFTNLMDNYNLMLTEAQARINKRSSSCSMTKLFMGVCVEKYISIMKQRTNKARVATGWAAKAPRQKNAMTIFAVGMAVEDYHSSLLELSTETEQSMAKVHQAFIHCIDGSQPAVKSSNAMNKNIRKSIRSSSIKIKSNAVILNASNRLAIDDLYNYRGIDLAGYYVACVCHAIPRERERAIEAAKKEIEDEKIAEMIQVQEEIHIATKAFSFKIGPRFQIYTKKNPRPIETEEMKLHLQQINAHHPHQSKTPDIDGQGNNNNNALLSSQSLKSISSKFSLFGNMLSAKTAGLFRKYNDDEQSNDGSDGSVTRRHKAMNPLDTVLTNQYFDYIVVVKNQFDTIGFGVNFHIDLANVGSSTKTGVNVSESQTHKSLRVMWMHSSLTIVNIDAVAHGEIELNDILLAVNSESVVGWDITRVNKVLDKIVLTDAEVTFQLRRYGIPAVPATKPLPTGQYAAKLQQQTGHVKKIMEDVQFLDNSLSREESTSRSGQLHSQTQAQVGSNTASPRSDTMSVGTHDEGEKHDKYPAVNNVIAPVPMPVTRSRKSSVSFSIVRDSSGEFSSCNYSSKYFKVPTIYKRPQNGGSYESASPDELKFLCNESMNGLDVQLCRGSRRFLINIYPNTIWTRTSVMNSTGGEVVRPSSAVSNSGTAVVSEVQARRVSRSTSFFHTPTLSAIGRGRSDSVSISVLPTGSGSFRGGSPLPQPNAPPAPLVYAEVECNRSEIIGSIERIDMWRLKVAMDQRKRLLLEQRLKSHEEMCR